MKKILSILTILVLLMGCSSSEKLFEKRLPITGLNIKIPKTANIIESIIYGADAIHFHGIKSLMIVKPGQATVERLSELEKWAKENQIQKFQKQLMKTGSAKTYTYIYQVDMYGIKQVVYHQMFQINGMNYICFANTVNEETAKLFHRVCNTIKK